MKYCYHISMELKIKGFQCSYDSMIYSEVPITDDERYCRLIEDAKDYTLRILNKKNETAEYTWSDIDSYQVRSFTFLHAVNEKSVN